jgi:hypothetical protein
VFLCEPSKEGFGLPGEYTSKAEPGYQALLRVPPPKLAKYEVRYHYVAMHAHLRDILAPGWAPMQSVHNNVLSRQVEIGQRPWHQSWQCPHHHICKAWDGVSFPGLMPIQDQLIDG